MQINELARLPFSVVASVAIYSGSGSIVDWADGVNLPSGVVYRFFGGDSTAVGVQKIPELCVEMQSPLIILWALARFYYLKEAKSFHAVQEEKLNNELHALGLALERTAESLFSNESSINKVLTKDSITRQVYEAMTHCLEVISTLSAIKERPENRGGK